MAGLGLLERTVDLDDAVTAAKCARAYEAIHAWVERALEPLQTELVATLFPIFAHCYVRMVGCASDEPSAAAAFLKRWSDAHAPRFTEELQGLESYTRADKVKDSEYVQRVLASKYRVRLGKVASEVMCEYLVRSGNVVVIRILNEHLDLVLEPTDAKARGFTPATLVEVTDESPSRKRHRGEAAITTTKLTLGVPKASELQEQPLKDDNDELPGFEDEFGCSLLRDATRRHLDQRRPSGLVGRGRQMMSGLEPTVLALTVVGGDASRVSCLRPSKDSTRLCGGLGDSSARVWRLDDNGSSDGASSSSGDKDKKSEFSTATTPAMVAHSGPVYGASWSTEARYLLTAAADGAVVLWDTESSALLGGASGGPPRGRQRETPLVRYNASDQAVWDVEWSEMSNGHLFASAGADRTARVWCTERVTPLRIFAGHWSDVSKVKWHPNAHYVLTASHDRSSRLWDMRAGGGSSNCVRLLDGAVSALTTLDVSPDGRLACAATRLGALHVWDLGTGKELWTQERAHSGPVYASAFSSDGVAIASGGKDRCLKIWDAAKSKEAVKVFATNGASPIFDITWTPGNLCLVSGPLLA